MINSDCPLIITEERLVDVARIFDGALRTLKKIISHRKFTPLHEVLLGIDKSHRKRADYFPSSDQFSRTRMLDVAGASGRTPLT